LGEQRRRSQRGRGTTEQVASRRLRKAVECSFQTDATARSAFLPISISQPRSAKISVGALFFSRTSPSRPGPVIPFAFAGRAAEIIACRTPAVVVNVSGALRGSPIDDKQAVVEAVSEPMCAGTQPRLMPMPTRFLGRPRVPVRFKYEPLRSIPASREGASRRRQGARRARPKMP